MSDYILEQNIHKHTDREVDLFSEYEQYFDKSPLSTSRKLQSFSKYVRRQEISRFLAKNELFQQQLEVPGSIVECGCYAGQGLMTFAQLSSIYEPYNHTRRVIGFDTFSGFPSVSEKDDNTETDWQEGDLFVSGEITDEIEKAISLFDKNRPIGHIPKAEIVRGDIAVTIPAYLEANQHLMVSMLYLDFDIYEPTKQAIELLVSRIPRGGLLAFDELNAPNCPGETLAVLETIGISNLHLQRTPFDPYICYARIE
jgi:hypothetical protein